MRDYSFFHYIEDKSELSLFFNSIMKRLSGLRCLCAPDNFRRDKSISDFQDEKFMDFCRYEVWMHNVVDRLRIWRKILYEYFVEFHGKWQYYASYHRISSIRQYGGEPEDYENGEIIADVPNEKLEPYSVLDVLYFKDTRDIVQDSTLQDINRFVGDIVAESHIDLLEGFKETFGKELTIYKSDGEGGMRAVNKLEHNMDMLSDQIDAEDDGSRLKAIESGILLIIHIIRTCRYDEDNVERLRMVSTASDALLNMNFDAMMDVVKKYKERYENDIHEC